MTRFDGFEMKHKVTLQEMQELMEMVTTRGRKVRAAVMGVKMDEATPRLAPQRL